MSGFLKRFKLIEYQVNPEGGIIYVDWKVKEWLDSFNDEGRYQKSQNEIEIYKKITKSGFEENLTTKHPKNFPPISLIVVTYNSDIWFENLRKMFHNLSPWLYEIILVDNGSNERSKVGIHQLGDTIKFIENDESKSFAAAVNQGCDIATGELFLIINPDVYIPKSSLWSLINFYSDNNGAAAIVPKLMLMKTPGFINGIGNVVPPFRWGYDLGLGHLDVGQFDHIKEVPSACFATVLIPHDKWDKVGRLDEEYPMYYEDSDWSYRARGLGYKILADTSSNVYHAYRGNQGNDGEISKEKLFHVTYGRLRFVRNNLKITSRFIYILTYMVFDISYLFFSLVENKFNLGFAKALKKGWSNYFFQSKENPRTGKLSIPPTIKFDSSLLPKVINGFPIIKKIFLEKYLKQNNQST